MVVGDKLMQLGGFAMECAEEVIVSGVGARVVIYLDVSEKMEGEGSSSRPKPDTLACDTQAACRTTAQNKMQHAVSPDVGTVLELQTHAIAFKAAATTARSFSHHYRSDAWGLESRSFRQRRSTHNPMMEPQL